MRSFVEPTYRNGLFELRRTYTCHIGLGVIIGLVLEGLTAGLPAEDPPQADVGWRRGRDSNPRDPFGSTRFRVVRHRPLGHLSAELRECTNPPVDVPFLAQRGIVFGLPDCHFYASCACTQAVSSVFGIGIIGFQHTEERLPDALREYSALPKLKAIRLT